MCSPHAWCRAPVGLFACEYSKFMSWSKCLGANAQTFPILQCIDLTRYVLIVPSLHRRTPPFPLHAHSRPNLSEPVAVSLYYNDSCFSPLRQLPNCLCRITLDHLIVTFETAGVWFSRCMLRCPYIIEHTQYAAVCGINSSHRIGDTLHSSCIVLGVFLPRPHRHCSSCVRRRAQGIIDRKERYCRDKQKHSLPSVLCQVLYLFPDHGPAS